MGNSHSDSGMFLEPRVLRQTPSTQVVQIWDYLDVGHSILRMEAYNYKCWSSHRCRGKEKRYSLEHRRSVSRVRRGGTED